MKAFHGQQAIKDKYIARVKAHCAADEIVAGLGFDPEANKGCAVGCTLNNYSHKAYETELGIPAMIAYLEDSIFEGLPKWARLDFPLEFLDAITPGADLKLVGWKFLDWLLVDPAHGVIKCSNIASRLANGENIDKAWAAEAAEATRMLPLAQKNKLIELLRGAPIE